MEEGEFSFFNFNLVYHSNELEHVGTMEIIEKASEKVMTKNQ